ncbi:MAG TPA: prepilin-type N-terminal cleavage/methylation domain-containing protein [Bryobacteraceae bacterium]|jgi:general secretion pathway protein I|nr:prepilin-type N-terminal cleavage/methylation domain-containing protein [Bryobacteraceae bacterium]
MNEQSQKQQRGFTLLEVLVATTIMGIAVAGLIAGLSQSVHNASRLADYDRAAMLARTKMNDLLLDANLPFTGTVSGEFDKDQSGGVESGWEASLRPFEAPLNAGPGTVVLQQVALEIWWQPESSGKTNATRRTMQLSGYRAATIPIQRQP